MPLNGTRAGEETRLLYGGENETLLARSVVLHRIRLLAQEGAAFLFGIQCHHQNQGSHCQHQEDFHAPMVAPTCQIVLYSGFANTKQL